MTHTAITTLRAFKRHYNRVKSVMEELGSEKPSFSIQAKNENDGHIVSIKTPGESWTIRFVLLMHRFLNPNDVLYIRHIRNQIRSEFGNELTADQFKEIDIKISRLSIGLAGVMDMNSGRPVAGSDVYKLLADGVLFGERDDYANRALKLAQGRALGGIFLWYEFYEYNLEGYKIVSAIIDLILQLEHSNRYQGLHQDSLPHTPRCIYCLSPEGPFQTEDHPIPETMGNYDMVLPKGMVCDACNHDLLSKLDSALIDSGSPLASLRILFVPYTKKGKFLETRFQNIHIARTGPKNIHLSIQHKKGAFKFHRDAKSGKNLLTLHPVGKKFNPRLFGRALYRIALGIVALEDGHDIACSKDFDTARLFIQGKMDFANNFLMRMKAEPRPLTLAYRLKGEGTQMILDLYGSIFILNLQETPILVLTESLKQEGFMSFPLHSSN